MSNNPFNFLLGKWTYRSLFNDTDVNTSPDKLLFGSGIITLSSIDLNGNLHGQLDLGNNYILNLSGSLISGQQFLSLKMEGDGIDNTPTAGWQDNYQGFFLPTKVSDLDVVVNPEEKPLIKINVISGIVMRTKPHNNQPKGFSATFYMVKASTSAPTTFTLRLQ